MRRLASLLLMTALLVTACKNKKTITTDDGKVTIDVSNVKDRAEEMRKMSEDLQKLPPLSLEQLKALLPEELMGAKRSNYSANSAMGAAVANAEYNTNDSTGLKLTVFDCAGPGGAGLYSTQYMGMFNMESDNDREYTKTIDFNGGKAFENCRKDRAKCTLTYFSGNRFMVSLEGENVSIDDIKQTAKGLNIK